MSGTQPEAAAPAEGADTNAAAAPAATGGDQPVSALEASPLEAAAAAAAVEPPKEGDTPKEGDAPKEGEPAAELKAEDYKLEDGVLPEGVDGETPFLKTFLEGAAKGGMDNESVNAVVKTVGPQLQAWLNERAQAGIESFKAINEQWRQEAMADPTIGGSTEKFNQNMVMVVQGMHGLGLPKETVDKALQTFTMTGAGNNPDVIRVMHAAFKRLSEPAPIQGSPAPKAISPAEAMYPSHSKSA